MRVRDEGPASANEGTREHPASTEDWLDSSVKDNLLVGIDERMPVWKYFFYGVQSLLADGLTALVIPVLIGAAMGLSAGDTGKIVQASLLGAGIVTIGQTLFVMRMPILQGPAIVFISILSASAGIFGLAETWTAMWVAGLLIGLLAFPIRLLQRLRPLCVQPIVYGTFLVLVSMSIAGAIFGQIFGQPGKPHYASGLNVLIAALPPLAALAFLVIAPRSSWRRGALILGALLALGVAALAGRTDFTVVGNTPWLRPVSLAPFGVAFNFWAILMVFIGYFVNLFESIGTFQYFCRNIGGRELSDDRLTAGIFIEGVGSAIGGAFGGAGTTTYTQNIGSILITGVASRFTFTASGIVLVLASFVAKLGALMASLPKPMVGGLLLATVAMMLMQGVRVLGALPPTAYQGLPREVQPFLSSPLIVGLAVAVLVYLVFAPWSRREEAALSGAQAPESVAAVSLPVEPQPQSLA
jgi:xanthine/uracil permease